jgi:uncharacterized protein YaeQ
MTLSHTLHHWKLALSDVDRGVYEPLDLRIAQHPSESERYLVTRVLAYALSYEAGIAFSKGGVSSADEPPVFVRDPTGIWHAWIDVGSPSAERLHRAAKLAPSVAVFTSARLPNVAAKARAGEIHRAEAIGVWQIDDAFIDAFAERVERNLALELTRTDGCLYLTLPGGRLVEGNIVCTSLLDAE